MQITLVPRRKQQAIPSTFTPMPQKPGSMFKSLGRWNYVTLTRSARIIPESLAKHLKKVRLARKLARILVGTVKVAIAGAVGVALALYVLSPLLHKIIVAAR